VPGEFRNQNAAVTAQHLLDGPPALLVQNDFRLGVRPLISRGKAPFFAVSFYNVCFRLPMAGYQVFPVCVANWVPS